MHSKLGLAIIISCLLIAAAGWLASSRSRDVDCEIFASICESGGTKFYQIGDDCVGCGACWNVAPEIFAEAPDGSGAMFAPQGECVIVRWTSRKACVSDFGSCFNPLISALYFCPVECIREKCYITK